MDSNSKLLIHTVTKYLHDEFDPESLSDFHDADAHKLFNELKKIMPAPSIVKRFSLISDAFIKFFNNLGEISVDIKNLETISVITKIDPKTVKAMRLLENYSEHVDDTNGPHLLIIDEQTTQKLRSDLNCQSDEHFRDIIRKVIPFIFEVGDKYAVLFGKSRITIRIHMEQPSSEQRFNGLPADELDTVVNGMFPEIDTELPPLMQRVFMEKFDFGLMSNDEFEANHIKIMQKELLKIVKMRSEQDSEVNKGIVNYILRQQFDLYHKMLAEQLITAIMDKKGNSELFLNYYSQKTVNIKGIKYKVPQLIDTEQTLWSVPNIKNIASQRRNDLNELAKKNDFIGKMEKILDTIDEDILREQKEVDEAKAAFTKATNELRELGNALSTHRTKLKQLRSTNNFDVDQEANLSAHISKLEQKEFKLMKIRDSSDRNVTKQQNDVTAMISKKKNTTIRLNSEIDKIEAIEKKMADVKGRFELVTTAIGVALSKKKEKIS